MTAYPISGRSNDFAAGSALLIVQPDGTVVPVSSATPAPVNGNLILASANFNRPANTTAYGVGSLIANSTIAASVVPLTLAVARTKDASFMIRRLHLKISDAAWLNATIRAHLYRASPTIANGDGAAWSTTESNYLGYSDVILDRSFIDGVKGFGVPNAGSEWSSVPATGTQNIFALLEARTVVTPVASGLYTLTAEVFQN